MRPDGLPLWAGPAEPGSVHDITTARWHALPIRAQIHQLKLGEITSVNSATTLLAGFPGRSPRDFLGKPGRSLARHKVMLLQGKVHGSAAQNLRTEAKNFIDWLATQDASVGQMANRQDILLLVQVEAGEGDQDTEVEWKNAKTRITTTIFYDPQRGLDGLRVDLLHELILHAKPATVKHMTAVNQGANPIYATTEDDVLAEEAAEHVNADLWYAAAVLALSRSSALMERMIADAAGHDEATATTVVNRLRDAQLITPQKATGIIEDLINQD